MRKICCSLLIFALFSVNLYAQVRVGVRAGIHWSKIQNRSAVTGDAFIPGFLVAVPVQIPLVNRWSMRLEPSVIQKGWQSRVDYTVPLGQPAGTGKLVLRYEEAEVPVLLSYRKRPGNRLAYYGLIGPSFAYALSGRLNISKESTTILSDNLRFEDRIQIGIWAGGGVEIPIGSLTGFLDARYQYGKYPATLISSNAKEIIHGFTVSVGCWLPSKK